MTGNGIGILAGDGDASAPAPDWFRKGVAISVWQSAGNDKSNWTRFAYRPWPPFCYLGLGWLSRLLGINSTKGSDKVGKSCNFWDKFRGDLLLAKKAGCTAFRFSFEWARIEPTRGKFDETAIARFNEMLDVMDELGLEPNATLHQFTHPVWFEDLGAFQKEENIPIFVEWSAVMFKLFHKRIRMWATFNEPSCYCFLGYGIAMMPPGQIFNLVAVGRVLLNILKAHTATYRALKVLPGGAHAQIGLVHHHITFAAQGKGILYSLAAYMAKWTEYFWAWDVIDHWMMTGEFEWKLPVLGSWIKYQDPAGKPPCDWWGVNYYSRPVVSWWLQPSAMPTEIMTDMMYPIYPQGLYDAIKRSSRYGIPMYITETGIADKEDQHRALFIDSYFKEVMRALADGYDVRGFYYWTLVDNFEWATGFTMKFGLYAWEVDGSKDRVLRDGAKALVRFYKTLPDDIASLKAVSQAAQKTAGAGLGVEDEIEREGVVYVSGRDETHVLHGPRDKVSERGVAVGVAALG